MKEQQVQKDSIEEFRRKNWLDFEDWFQNLNLQAKLKQIPVMLPSKQTIKQTLLFSDIQQKKPMRNIDYMSRILKKLPVFVWLSQKPLTKSDIQITYLIGLELYHACNIDQLSNFVRKNQIENQITVISDAKSIQQLYHNVKNKTQKQKLSVKTIYLYEDTKKLEHLNINNSSMPGVIIIQSIQEISISYYDSMVRGQSKALPKIVSHLQSLQSLKWKQKTATSILESSINRKFSQEMFLQLAKKHFTHEKMDIQELELEYPENPDYHREEDQKKIINFYTSNSFGFKILNAILRGTDDPYALAYVSFFAADLYRIIKIINEKNQSQNTISKVYRRTELSEQQFNFFRRNMSNNSLIELRGFISTSKRLEVTFSFEGNTLIQINIDNQNRNQNGINKKGFADISLLSSFAMQEEVLFHPYNSYEIIYAGSMTQKQIRQFSSFNIDYQFQQLQWHYPEMINLKYLVILKLRSDISLLEFKMHNKIQIEELSEEKQQEFDKKWRQLSNKSRKIQFFTKNQHKILKIIKDFGRKGNYEQILPKNEVIYDTLMYPQQQTKDKNDFIIMRSPQFTKQSNFPLLIWFDDKQPPQQEIQECYLAGFCLYHIKEDLKQLQKFMIISHPNKVSVIIKNSNRLPDLFLIYLEFANFLFLCFYDEGIRINKNLKIEYPQMKIVRKLKDCSFLKGIPEFSELNMKKQSSQIVKFPMVKNLSFKQQKYLFNTLLPNFNCFYNEAETQKQKNKDYLVQILLKYLQTTKSNSIYEEINNRMIKKAKDPLIYPQESLMINYLKKAIHQIWKQSSKQKKQGNYIFEATLSKIQIDFIHENVGKYCVNQIFLIFKKTRRTQRKLNVQFSIEINDNNQPQCRNGFIVLRNFLIFNLHNHFLLKKIESKQGLNLNKYLQVTIQPLSNPQKFEQARLLFKRHSIQKQNIWDRIKKSYMLNCCLQQNPNEIKRIHISSNDCTGFFPMVIMTRCQFQNLEDLIFSDSVMNDRQIYFLARLKFPALKKLSFIIKNQGLSGLGIKLLSLTCFESLKNLLIYGFESDHQAMKNLAQFKFPSLNTLTLKEWKFTASGIIQLFIFDYQHIPQILLFSNQTMNKKIYETKLKKMGKNNLRII